MPELCTLVAADMDVLTQRHVTMTQRRFTIMVIVQNMTFVIFVVETDPLAQVAQTQLLVTIIPV